MEILKLAVGEVVLYKGQKFKIKELIDLEFVSAEDSLSGKLKQLPIKFLFKLKEKDKILPSASVTEIKEKDWELAVKKFEIIKPIIEAGGGRRLVEEVGLKNKINPATLYRWINRYVSTGNISSLVSIGQRGGKGLNRLPKKVDAIITKTIDELYLNSQKRTMQKVFETVQQRCKKDGLPAPNISTLRKRINSLPDETKTARRDGIKAAKQKFQPLKGNFPNADYPLSYVQIDHTKLDIILVDDIYRKPIGRPWITMAIDVYSRMAVGFYISFDPPGAMGTGLCIANVILPKEKWIASMGLEVSWPCWGIMQTIHLDNAREFKGNMLKRACQEYGINIEFRPPGTPHWGGHIERFMGTLLKEIHTLPGTTFNNIKLRENYNSEKRAALTLKELEKWFTIYLTEIYHNKVHSGIGMTPLTKYKEGILGSDEKPGIGLPEKILDERKLKLDFMPYEERSIQEYGVMIGNICYYHDILRRWIHHTSSRSIKSKEKSKFIFKIDPRDISIIYFFDPELKDYYPIPYRDTSRPPISIWEYREIVKRLKDNGFNKVSEESIFNARTRMQEIEEAAQKKSRSAKRKTPKKAVRKSIHKELKTDAPTFEADVEIQTSNKIKPFEDLE